MSDAAVSVFDVLTTGPYLREYGFLLRDQFPAYSGAVPETVRTVTRDSNGETSSEHRPRPGTAGGLPAAVSEITVLV
jgi:molybdate/tungstate transport system substrate-binding protein